MGLHPNAVGNSANPEKVLPASRQYVVENWELKDVHIGYTTTVCSG